MHLRIIRRASDRRAGLECGASGAKLVVLTISKSGVRIEGVFIEEESLESRLNGKSRPQTEIVRQLVLHRNLSGVKTVLVSDEASGSCFVVMPKMSNPDAEGALRLHARKSLAWERADPIMAHLDSEFPNDRTGSVVGLADWKAVKPWRKLIENSGGVMWDVTVRASAFLALAQSQGWNAEHEVVLVADLGASSSCLYILDGRSVIFMRLIPVGGDALTKALTAAVSTAEGNLRLSEAEAEDFKASGDLSRVGMMLRPLVERISKEVTRSIQFFRENTGRNVTAVYATGGTARMGPLIAHLAAATSLPVKIVDPLADLEFADENIREFAGKNGDRLSVAVGLALAGSPAISLLPKPARISRCLAKYAALAAIIMLAVGFLPLTFAGILQTVRTRGIRSDIERHRRELLRLGAGGEQVEALQAEADKLSERLRMLDALVVREPSWSGAMVALSDAVPEDVVLTRISTKSSKDGAGRMTMEGKVLHSATGFDEAIASLLAALNASSFFRRASITGAEAKPTGKTMGTFQVECDLVY